ncbi:hypothetical protein GCM10007981_00060 [Thermocladium modestius]|uniref:HTH marR-type domain-containing protein n=1 Tax=Thermocladium modestius TaxID=62609 RepID=A0A830GS11_9CREN|nr:MarR family transcriptional regulator [Thermocladium modestius]GGP18830.1 hypothetical protein GCM10007981_00060 [Thermocladium modestius]
MSSNHSNSLAAAVLLIGALFITVSIIAMIGALYMYRYSNFEYMGMMRGMSFYAFVVPIPFLIIGIAIVAYSLTSMRSRPATSLVETASPPSFPDDQVLKLLPEQERRVVEYLMEAGGEAFQYKMARDLSLDKVKSWRIIRRLEEKGLVEVDKVKGRNLIRLRKHPA